MELHQLRHFLAVAETASFTKGAERAAVSQPALSASVAKLEAELGVKLFERDKRRVVITRAGRKLIETAKTVVNTCNKAKSELKDIQADQGLRLGVINTLPMRRVSLLLEQFAYNFPDISVLLQDAPSDDIEALLNEGQIDVALTAISAHRGPNPAIKSRALYSEQYFVMVPSAHRMGARRSIKLAELENEPFVARSHCEGRHDFANILEEKGIRLRTVCRTNQDGRALAFVDAGLGIAYLPGKFESPGVTAVPIADFHYERTIGVCWRSQDETPAALSFVNFAETNNWHE
jgi:DNA-binding transcriptional LysR family regulator